MDVVDANASAGLLGLGTGLEALGALAAKGAQGFWTAAKRRVVSRSVLDPGAAYESEGLASGLASRAARGPRSPRVDLASL